MSSYGCDCDRMIRLIRAAGGVGVDPDTDLEGHFREEGFYLRRLVAAGKLPRSVLERILSEHQKFIVQIRKYGEPDPAALKLHALYEDNIVKQYFPNV